MKTKEQQKEDLVFYLEDKYPIPREELESYTLERLYELQRDHIEQAYI